MTREERKEYQKDWMRRKREESRKKGLCTVCSTHPADPGHTMCRECREKQHQYNVERNRMKVQRWRDGGLCTVCGMPAAEGHKMCERHLEQKRGLHTKPESDPAPPKKAHKDTLAEINEQARAMGLSYGKYQALRFLRMI